MPTATSVGMPTHFFFGHSHGTESTGGEIFRMRIARCRQVEAIQLFQAAQCRQSARPAILDKHDVEVVAAGRAGRLNAWQNIAMRCIFINQGDARGLFIQGIEDLVLICQDWHNLGIEDAQFLALVWGVRPLQDPSAGWYPAADTNGRNSEHTTSNISMVLKCPHLY